MGLPARAIMGITAVAFARVVKTCKKALQLKEW
jgi:hypothetical protein